MEDSLFDGSQFELKLPRRRFEIEPLLKLYDGDTAALAHALNVSQRSVQRWTETGISFLQADVMACRVGMNAMNIWPDWLEDDKPGDELIDAIEVLFPYEREQR